jgi:hypothetical protein
MSRAESSKQEQPTQCINLGMIYQCHSQPIVDLNSKTNDARH